MCIFCDIVSGKIPNYTVYEDDKVLAFLDVNPTSKGHTLVVPKAHCSSFLDCETEDLNHCMQVAQQLANQIKEKLNCDGINILTNIGQAAGQSVMHFHIHIIPRYENDDHLTLQFNSIGEVDLESICKQITE